MKARKPRPYWLAGGTESCHLCSHVHVLEMEFRCSGCDRGICSHCAVLLHETREVVCTPCHGGEEGES